MMETDSVGKSAKEEAAILRSLLNEVRMDRDAAQKEYSEQVALLREQTKEMDHKLKEAIRLQKESGGKKRGYDEAGKRSI